MPLLKTLLDEIGRSIVEVEELLGELKISLGDMPRIPQMGGQRHYDEQDHYLQVNVHERVERLLAARQRVLTALQGLREYTDNKKKSVGKRRQAQTSLDAREPVAGKLDRDLRELFAPIEGGRSDVIQRLKEALGL